MEIYTMERPSMSLTPVCAPAYGSVSAAAWVAPLARVAPLSRVHQVQIQAELAQILVRGNSNTVTLKGREGFVGSNGTSVKTDGASGVPPRGRPV